MKAATAILGLVPFSFAAILDTYKFIDGDQDLSIWPSTDTWFPSYAQMFSANAVTIGAGCSNFGVPNNSPQETQDLYDAINTVSQSSGVDARFILAVVVQESSGCVRAPTTNYGVSNPGLMQSHNGAGSCNSGAVQNPCPKAEILQMIKDGVEGTADGDGLSQLLGKAVGPGDLKYYQAARMYNSGSIASSGNLNSGIATHCYVTDTANRLTGWVRADKSCTLDGTPPIGAGVSLAVVYDNAFSFAGSLLSGGDASTPSATPLPTAEAIQSIPTTFATSVTQSTATPIAEKAAVNPVGTVPSPVPTPPVTLNSKAVTVASNPAPQSPGNCSGWVLVKYGQSCNDVAETAGLDFAQFQAINPFIDAVCGNLWAGYDYCVSTA